MGLGFLATLDQTVQDWAAATAGYARAVATTRQPRWACYWQSEQAAIELTLGRPDRAEALARASLALALDLGDGELTTCGEARLARILTELGRHVEAEPRVAAATAALQARSDLRGVAMTCITRGDLLLDQGWWDEAEQAFAEGAALAVGRRWAVVDAQLASGIGVARLFAGRDGSEPALRDSLVRHRDVLGRTGAWYPLAWLAALYRLERPRLAATTLAEAEAERGPDPSGTKQRFLDRLGLLLRREPAPEEPMDRLSVDLRLVTRLLAAR